MNISKNFSLAEMIATSHKGIDNTPSETITAHLKDTAEHMLQSIRETYGRPIHINSGYRCPKLNSAVGGAANSAHKYGYAADTVPASGSMKDYMDAVLDWSKTHVFDQIILESVSGGIPKWIHLGWKHDDGKGHVTQRRQILVMRNGKYSVYTGKL